MDPTAMSGEEPFAGELAHEAMALVPVAEKLAYIQACRICPDVVREETPHGMFLSFCEGDMWDAATRLARHWQMRLDIFGARKAFVKLPQALLLDEGLPRGQGPVLVPPDSFGDSVIYLELRKHLNDDTSALQSWLQLFWYATHLAISRSQETLRGCSSGSRIVHIVRLDLHSQADCKAAENIRTFYAEALCAIPIHFHLLFVDPPAGTDLIRVERVASVRARSLSHASVPASLHIGSRGQVLQSLERAGLRAEGIPVSCGGKWRFERGSKAQPAAHERDLLELSRGATQTSCPMMMSPPTEALEPEPVLRLEGPTVPRANKREGGVATSLEQEEFLLSCELLDTPTCVPSPTDSRDLPSPLALPLQANQSRQEASFGNPGAAPHSRPEHALAESPMPVTSASAESNSDLLAQALGQQRAWEFSARDGVESYNARRLPDDIFQQAYFDANESNETTGQRGVKAAHPEKLSGSMLSDQQSLVVVNEETTRLDHDHVNLTMAPLPPVKKEVPQGNNRLPCLSAEVHCASPVEERPAQSACSPPASVPSSASSDPFQGNLVHDAIAFVGDSEAYLQAASRCPAVVTSESNHADYLSYCKGDCWAAATRLAAYWRIRLEVFGPVSAFLPLQEALTDADWACLSFHQMPMLPPDKLGRPVFFVDKTMRNDPFVKSLSLEMRIHRMFTFLQLCCDSARGAGGDFVIMCHLNTLFNAQDKHDRQILDLCKRLLSEALCGQLCEFHFVLCVDDITTSRMLPMMGLIKVALSTLKAVNSYLGSLKPFFHLGTHEDVLGSLVECGFIPKHLPLAFSGSYNPETDWAAFLRQHRFFRGRVWPSKPAEALAELQAVCGSVSEVSRIEAAEAATRQRRRVATARPDCHSSTMALLPHAKGASSSDHRDDLSAILTANQGLVEDSVERILAQRRQRKLERDKLYQRKRRAQREKTRK